MSNTALFLATGIVVREKGVNSRNETYEMLPTEDNSTKYLMTPDEGKVTQFKIFSETENIYEVYIFINYSHLLERDKTQTKVKTHDGFCLLTRYDDYKNYKIGLAELFFEDFWFDSNFEVAKAGDTIQIERLDFSIPSKFYVQKNYTFNIVDIQDIDFTDPSTYPNATVTTTEINLLQSYSGKFYTKNIAALNGIESANKIEFTKLLTYICFRTDYIVNHILLIFTMRDNNNQDKNYETIKLAVRKKYVNNDDSLYALLPKIDQVIGELLKDWGYVDDVDASFMFDGKSIDYIRNYYNSISSFYVTLLEADEKVYFKYDNHGNPKNFQGTNLTHDGELDDDGNVIHVSQEVKDKKDSERRVAYLFKYLTTEGLAIFDFEQRMAWLKDLVNQVKLEQQNANTATQNNFIKLLNTFVNKDEADSLLDYLLENNGAQTNFEVVYNKLDDGRLERYPVISWFVDQATNRMFFIYSIYNAWKFSKYSFYSPSSNMYRGINLDCYFLNDGKKYYPQYDAQNNLKSGSIPILNFSITKLGDDGSFTANTYSPKKELQREIVEIDQIVTTVNYNIYDIQGDGMSETTTNFSFGKYHLYQSITLLGYKGTYEISVPDHTPIPAFLFYYAKDFERLKLFDAGLSFAIQLGIEVGLFFAFGGATVIKSLEYLKYTTNLYRVFIGEATGAEAILFYKGLYNASELYTLSASVMGSFMIFLSDTARTPEEKAYYAKVSMYLLSSTLMGAYISGVARSKINTLLDEIIIDPLYNQLRTQHPEIYNMIVKAKGISVAEMADFRTKFIKDRPNLRVIFDNSFDDGLKVAFSKEYGSITDLKVWDSLNEAENALSNWKSLYTKNILDRASPSIIKSDADVSAIVEYYSISSLRNTLEPLSFTKRWTTINEISSNLLNEIKINDDLLKGWVRYRFEPNLVEKFTSLSETQLLSLLKRYGNVSEEGFMMIRSNPKIHIDRLLKYPEATHHIDKFNTRRAEMLPPNFKEADKGEFFNLHEIDNFIEVEIAYGGRARSSLKTEAGDIIMESGSLKGQSLDPLGLSSEAISSWTNKFNKNFNKFKVSIDRHFGKIDMPPNGLPHLNKVAIDYKYMDEISVSIGESPNYLRFQVDQYILSNFPQYNNSTYLIKVNY